MQEKGAGYTKLSCKWNAKKGLNAHDPLPVALKKVCTGSYSGPSAAEIEILRFHARGSHIESIEPFATGIKMTSRDQRANLY